ncbi:MAG: pantoate--beta-alanine ligase [Phycisphaerales bacterium]
MRLVEDPEDLSPSTGCAFVPTMGALHEGHAALIRHAKATGLPVVVSVFVNPTQFGANEDLDKYPRTLDADMAIAEANGASIVFVPSLHRVYPEGTAAATDLAARVPLPDVATRPGLEDRCRPGHFAGVQLVVARLFDMVRPSIAVFGEKDWQQLKLVEAMVRIAHGSTPNRWPSLRIAAHPTVRERDGLALSSRNRYMPAEWRERSLGIARALQVAHTAQRPSTAEEQMLATLKAHDFTVDYAVVRDAETLMPVTGLETRTRALIAARLTWPGGGVRLIDNAPLAIWR